MSILSQFEKTKHGDWGKKKKVPTTPANQKQIHFSELKNAYSEG